MFLRTSAFLVPSLSQNPTPPSLTYADPAPWCAYAGEPASTRFGVGSSQVIMSSFVTFVVLSGSFSRSGQSSCYRRCERTTSPTRLPWSLSPSLLVYLSWSQFARSQDFQQNWHTCFGVLILILTFHSRSNSAHLLHLSNAAPVFIGTSLLSHPQSVARAWPLHFSFHC